MNNLLKNFICLSCSIKVYIPTTINVDQPIDTTEYVNRAALLLAELFGGANSESIMGYYKTNEGKLVVERNIRVCASCDSESLDKNLDKVIELCQAIKSELKQESVAIEVNNEMFFII